MAISYPPIFVNDYLKEKALDRFDVAIPFFPTGPSDIDQLTEQFPEGLYCVFDRMFRMRRKAFPHIKDEQLLYYFYKMSGDPEALIETTQLVQDLLDRADESAQEVNSWIQSKLILNDEGKKVYVKDGKEFLPVYFHEFNIYQLEEARDIVDFGTARTFAGNKIIISYCYHSVGEDKKTVDGVEKRTYNDTIL